MTAIAEGRIGPLVRPTTAGRGSNQTDVRAHNERLLLSLIRRHGSLTKAEISRLSGLSAQAISVIMRKLEDDGLLRRGKPVRGRIGQPSTPLALEGGGALSFGLKIGRRSAELVLIDFVGIVRHALNRPYAWPMPGAILDFMRSGVADILAALTPEDRNRIVGLGIASPFELWNWEEGVGAPPGAMDIWRSADLVQAIQADLPFPVYLQNDATAACGAEFVFGRGQEFTDYLYFFIGFFIGGGVVLNGGLFSGTTGNAGALGSFPIRGRDGTMRQLIDVASSSILEARIRSAGLDPAPLWSRTDGWSMFEAFTDDWIADIAPHLAEAIVASCSVIDFSAAVIDGGFPDEIRSRVVAATRDAIMDFNLQGIAPPRIVEGTVGAQARAVGGACLPFFDKYIHASNPFPADHG